MKTSKKLEELMRILHNEDVIERGNDYSILGTPHIPIAHRSEYVSLRARFSCINQKLNALAEHLGLEFEYVEQEPASIVMKKAAKK